MGWLVLDIDLINPRVLFFTYLDGFLCRLTLQLLNWRLILISSPDPSSFSSVMFKFKFIFRYLFLSLESTINNNSTQILPALALVIFHRRTMAEVLHLAFGLLLLLHFLAAVGADGFGE